LPKAIKITGGRIPKTHRKNSKNSSEEFQNRFGRIRNLAHMISKSQPDGVQKVEARDQFMFAPVGHLFIPRGWLFIPGMCFSRVQNHGTSLQRRRTNGSSRHIFMHFAPTITYPRSYFYIKNEKVGVKNARKKRNSPFSAPKTHFQAPRLCGVDSARSPLSIPHGFSA